MHPEILTEKQLALQGLVSRFNRQFYLVGGTALALQLGHRRSIDFDLFSAIDFDNAKILRQARNIFSIEKIMIKLQGQMTVKINDVMMTWYHFPFNLPHKLKWEAVITMPDILTLAAMKIYALGQRAKWKDYVDLYFIFQKYSLTNIVSYARRFFKGEINERLIREQLDYFEDIDYREAVEFMPGFAVSEEKVKGTLQQIAVS